MNKKTILLFVLCLLVISCEKEQKPTTDVKVTVYDSNYEVITNYPVFLVSMREGFCSMNSSSIIPGSESELISSGVTNADGNCRFSVESEDTRCYRVIAAETTCYLEEGHELGFNRFNSIGLILKDKSVLKIRIKEKLVGYTLSYNISLIEKDWPYSDILIEFEYNYSVTQNDVENDFITMPFNPNKYKILVEWNSNSDGSSGSIFSRSQSLDGTRCDDLVFEIY